MAAIRWLAGERRSRAFAPELRPSLDWALLLLVVGGLALAILAETVSRPALEAPLRDLAVVSIVAAGLAWLLSRWRAAVGRWFTVGVLCLLIVGAAKSLRVPAAIVLLSVPVAAAAQLLGLAAAALVAAVAPTLLLWPPLRAEIGIESTTVVLAELGVWATWLAFAGTYRPIYRLAEWWEWHAARSEELVQTARERKAQLEQALSGLVNANRQLALANDRVASLRQLAEEAQKAKAQFVAKVSHEFRTPLNMIIGLVNLMLDNPRIYTVTLPPEMTKDLEIVRRNCQHLASMVNDVLSLSQMDAQRLVLHKERVDIAELIAAAVEAVTPLTAKKGLQLDVTIPEGLPLVYCDRTRIQQVVLNLVSNAARYTERGRIAIEVQTIDTRVRVKVSDTGPGIPPGETERIFEPFYQAASELWRDRGGTGLGLAISREFVRRHGGRMWVESTLGVGSTFSFELPITAPAQPAAAPAHRIREDWIWRQDAFLSGAAAAAPLRPRVVVWDCDGGLVSELDRYADEAEFVYVGSAQELRRAIGEVPAHAAIVNGRDPDELAALVEEARRASNGTPIMGCSVPRRVARALEAGAIGYLVKPISPSDLWEAVQAAGHVVERVLVVDDDPDFVRLMRRMLHVSAPALEVVEASSGCEALAAMRAAPFDLVLLDVVMPGMDGWQVLEEKRRDPALRPIPAILVSARDPVEEPPVSDTICATAGGGLTVSQILNCALQFSALLYGPRPSPGQASLRTAAD